MSFFVVLLIIKVNLKIIIIMLLFSIIIKVFIYKYGECGEVVNTAVCGSVMRGFESRHSPHFLFKDNFMKKILKRVLETENETLKFGKELLKHLPNNLNLIILKGELGAGKTTLVKGIAKSLNIKDEIISPTYGYKREYNGLVHYDLYLTKKMKSKDLQSLISEDLENNLVIIEWGEKLPKIKNSIIITMKVISDNGRIIEIEEV